MRAIAKRFQGVSAFLLTPTKDNGETLDLAALKRFIDFQLECGVDSITVFGSTGGVGSFSEAERQEVIETAVRHLAGRAPLIAGTGAISTAETIRLSKFAASVGAAAALVVPINYWKPTDDELFAHYKAIAGAVDLPVGIYNNPGTTGVDMMPALLARICEIDNIAFIKESSSDIRRITATLQRTKGEICVMNGNDAAAPAAYAAGANGWFAGSCSIMPRECVAIHKAALIDGDLARAAKLFEPIFPICEFMSSRGYIRVAHASCDILGRPMGTPRAPIRMLSEADQRSLKGLLQDAGVLHAVAA